MTPDQLYPLEVNPKTLEPFLRLRKHKDIILTPPRWEDAPHFVPLFNDPRVYEGLLRPPLPYTLKDGEDWLQLTKPNIDALLQELKDAQGSDSLKIIGGCPVSSIREIKEDGTDIFLGSIAITRCTFPELIDTDSVDWEHKEEKAAANEKLEVGDPNIIWSIGDYLAPSHHGQGIMTDAVETLLHGWAIPRMNVRAVLTAAFVGNEGSLRVFQKNGFKMVRKIEEYQVVRGKMRGLYVIEWEAPSETV